MNLARKLAVAFCCVAVLAACTNPQASSAPKVSHSTTTTTTAPVPPGGYGLLPSDPGLTDRIILKSSRSTAGKPIPGTLLVVNHTAASINLTKTCQPSYAVALTNSKYAPRVAFATVCSSAPFVIAPGTNRFPISITTTYLACQQSQSSSSDLPTCIKSGAPPLPSGTYDAVLIGDGLALPRPQPVPVVLVE
jgi:hypothetical protein